MNKLREQDFFVSTASGSPPITLELSGLGPVPNFKNKKMIRTWLDKVGKVRQWINGHWWVREDTIKIRNLPITLPERQAWMEWAITLLESQLRSAFQTRGVGMQTEPLARSLIASLVPFNDCWTQCPEVHIKCVLVEKGKEGATILIERL